MPDPDERQGSAETKMPLRAHSPFEGCRRRHACPIRTEMVLQLRIVLLAALAVCAAGFVATASMASSRVWSSGCSSVHVDAGPPLTSCHRSIFAGYPNLMKRGCTAVGTRGANQLWSCPKT